jgi:hypothetical protein
MLQFLDKLVNHFIVYFYSFYEFLVGVFDVPFLHQLLSFLLRFDPLFLALFFSLRFHMKFGAVKNEDDFDPVHLKHSHFGHAVVYQLFNALVRGETLVNISI